MHPNINASQSPQRSSALLCLLALALACACAPNSRPLRGEKGDDTGAKKAARPALELQHPILRFVPASSELVLVAPSLDKLLETAHVLAPMAQQVPAAAYWLDALRNTAGAITESATWTRYGIDARADLAVFSDGKSSTMLLPFVAGAAGHEDLSAALYATHSELLRDDTGTVLALHWSLDPGQASAPWLAAMQAAASGLSYAGIEQAERASRFAAEAGAGAAAPGTATAVWGSVDIGRILTSAGLPCAALVGQLNLQALSVSIKTSSTAADLYMDLPLGAETAADLRALLGPSASSGMSSLREQEGLSASLQLDLGAVANALRRQQCRELGDMLADSLERIGVAPTSVHFAGSRFDPSELSGRVALQLGLLDKSFFAALLDGIPGRSLFESRIHLGGQKVVKLGVPLMSTLYYQLSHQRLLFSTHKAMMVELLAAPADTGEILFMQAVPERLPQLTQLLSLAMPWREAELVSTLLRQFELLRAELLLKDNRLLFHGRALVPDA